MRDSGQAVVIWGAGSKGVTILNMLKVAAGLDPVEYVVDINPRKQGKYVAGTGQMIVAPEFLREHRPGTVLVMNPVYTNEICGAVGGLGISPNVLAV